MQTLTVHPNEPLDCMLHVRFYGRKLSRIIHTRNMARKSSKMISLSLSDLFWESRVLFQFSIRVEVALLGPDFANILNIFELYI